MNQKKLTSIPFISMSRSAFIENLTSSEGWRARARAYHAKMTRRKDA